MTNITLNCLSLSEDPDDNVFDVNIDKSKSVNNLKEVIKEKKRPEFNNFPANKLILWQVNIPLDAPNELTALLSDITNLSIENDLQGTKLHPARCISYYFVNQPTEMHLSVIVQKPTTDSTPFEFLSVSASATVIADRIKDSNHFTYFGPDLSFLEELERNEKRRVRTIFGPNNQPDPAWRREVEEVQPWVQGVYEKLAETFQLAVNWDSRRGGGPGENYADHYLTHLDCNVERNNIDFTKCWAFETKGAWQTPLLNKALVQCHRYSSRFFESATNRVSKYVSIITDARKYRLWYAYCDQHGMRGGLTQDYDWNQDTLEILGCVFKTFRNANLLRASASPGDFGNFGTSGDIFADQRAINKALYDVIVEWAKKLSPLRLPVVTTTIGDIEARRLLGTGSNTVVFEGRTTNDVRVAIKYCLNNDPLKREAETLMKLNEVKGIPRLLYEDFDGMIPYIVTSMVGRKVTKVDAPIACNIIIDILEVLKNLHDHHYIHNDINPGNIVKVDDKFRLIDFGRAVYWCDKRDTVPSSWLKGHIIFASHNWGKYLGAGDDLEALCYTVAFMHNQNKEYWRAAALDPFKALHKKEKITKVLHLFDDLPRVFQDFFCYVYDLDIAATPNYEYWHKRFTSTASDLASLPKKRLSETPLESSEGKSGQRPRA